MFPIPFLDMVERAILVLLHNAGATPHGGVEALQTPKQCRRGFALARLPELPMREGTKNMLLHGRQVG
jgi:hypothetical protein